VTCVQNSNKFADKFKTKSSRLNNWNYSTPGFYFITIKTLNDNNFFGKIINNKMELSAIGEIANQCLIDISKHFLNITLDEYIVMPNHVHILILVETPDNIVETHHGASLQIKYQNYHFHRLAIKSNQTIPKIINQFKSSVKRICNQKNLFFGWQTRFYDQIIKSETELNNIRQYIKNNPINWKNNF